MPKQRSLTMLTVVIVIATTSLPGCGDDAPTPAADAGTTSPSETFKRDVEWLELKQDLAPDAWLLERAEATGTPISAELRDALRQSLTVATRRLGESKRMIANRAVQLERMLAREGQNDSAVALIIDLTSAIGEPGQTEGFGAVTQHYFTMRKSGLSRDRALQEIKLRYGPRT